MSQSENLKIRFKPDLTEEFIYPDRARVYGQSMMGVKEPGDASLAGWIYKVLGEKILAESCFYYVAIAAERDGMAKLPTQARIRFADWLRDQKDFENAEELLNFPVEPVFEATRIQHLGKLFFHMKKYPQALECFTQALALRQKSGDAELIESSKFGITMTEAALAKAKKKK